MAGRRSNAALALGLLLLCSCIAGSLQQADSKGDSKKEESKAATVKTVGGSMPAKEVQEADPSSSKKPAAPAAKTPKAEAAPAAAAQSRKQGPKPAPQKVQVVAIAPEAEVENNDDIDVEGGLRAVGDGRWEGGCRRL
jgi:hypothetical protein